MGGQCGQPTVLYMRVYPMSTKQSISKDSHTGKCDQKGCKLQCKDVIGKKVKTSFVLHQIVPILYMLRPAYHFPYLNWDSVLCL